jgi:hypothetical protein
VAWLRIDDSLYDHPKFISLDPRAVKLWLFALAWAGRHLTDGFVPDSARGVIGMRTLPQWRAVAGGLERAKLWRRATNDRGEPGYQIHDYCEYNPPKEQIESARAKNRQKQAGWRKRPPCNAVTNAAPVPSPSPSLSTSLSHTEPGPNGGQSTGATWEDAHAGIHGMKAAIYPHVSQQ